MGFSISVICGGLIFSDIPDADCLGVEIEYCSVDAAFVKYTFLVYNEDTLRYV